MTVIQLYMGLTALVYTGIAVDQSCAIGVFVPDGATSDRTDLAATVEAATERTAIHLDKSCVHIAVHHITATEGITCQFNVVGLLVVQFLNVFIRRSGGLRGVLIAITHITVVDGQVGITINGTTLTATIHITCDGRNTIVENGTVHLTDGYGGNVNGIHLVGGYIHNFSQNGLVVLTHMTQVAATIDVTCHTAFDIDVGSGRKSL